MKWIFQKDLRAKPQGDLNFPWGPLFIFSQYSKRYVLRILGKL
jgi:hypothetical protein